jgi:1-acyl-sn-glycerol-3-phosphate acyltransferase
VSLSQRLIVALFRGLTGALFRIDASQAGGIPRQGPLILVTNHINIMEIPIIYSHLQPRKLHGLVLAERWKNPIVGWGLDVCGTIPLERGGVNLDAMRQALAALEAGEMLIISPEGTRSGHGRLQPAHPGVVTLALKSGAPLLPIGYSGGEAYQENFKRLRRTPFHMAVGRPFRLDAHGEPPTREQRTQMVDEIMYRVAAILPPDYRGVYADLEKATTRYVISGA